MKQIAAALFTSLTLIPVAAAQALPTDAVVDVREDMDADYFGAQLVKCSTVQSMAVENEVIEEGERRTEKVADFADLILDRKTGQPRYVLLSRGGLGSIGDTLIPVPVGEVRAEWKADEEGGRSICLRTDIDGERLAEAPEFDEDAWDRGDGAWCRNVDAYFDGRMQDSARPDDEDEQGASEGAQRSSLFRLGEMVGNGLHNGSEDKIASVRDVVLDPASMKIAYVVIGSGGVLGIGDEMRAVAPGAVRHMRAEDGSLECWTSMTKTDLESAPTFDESRWKLQGTAEFAERVEEATGDIQG